MPSHHQTIQDKFAMGITWWVAILLMSMFLWLVSDMVIHGVSGLSWDFLTTSPMNAGREGGIASILVSTALILLVCMTVTLPIGLGTSILLSEFTHQFKWTGNLVRRSLDVLAGVPSIVFGLFGNAFFCVTLGLGFSIISGGLTLACMVLPILIRSTEEGFRALPADYRFSAAALGLSQTSTLISLLIPAAMPALLAGFILGLGRAIAETAALIFTSGYVDRMPESLWDSGRALSIHIYDLSMNVPGGDTNAYTSALVLMTLLLLINASAQTIGNRWSSKKVFVA